MSGSSCRGLGDVGGVVDGAGGEVAFEQQLAADVVHDGVQVLPGIAGGGEVAGDVNEVLVAEVLGHGAELLLVGVAGCGGLEDVAEAALLDLLGGAACVDEDALVALGDGRAGRGGGRAEGGHQEVGVVAGDEALEQAGGGGGVGPVVIGDELDGAAEEAAGGVDLVAPELQAVEVMAGGVGEVAGLGEGDADADGVGGGAGRSGGQGGTGGQEVSAFHAFSRYWGRLVR